MKKLRHHVIPNAVALAAYRDLEGLVKAFLSSYDRFLEAKDRLPDIVHGKLMNLVPRHAAKQVQVVFRDSHAQDGRISITVKLAPIRQYIDGTFPTTMSQTASFADQSKIDWVMD